MTEEQFHRFKKHYLMEGYKRAIKKMSLKESLGYEFSDDIESVIDFDNKFKQLLIDIFMENNDESQGVLAQKFANDIVNYLKGYIPALISKKLDEY